MAIFREIAYRSIAFLALCLTVAGWASSPAIAQKETTFDVTVTPQALEYARKQVDQNTHAPLSALGKLAASQFAVFGKALGIPAEELKSPRVGWHGTFVIAMTNKWLYRTDISGNQTFRPVSNLPYVVANFEQGKYSSADEGQIDRLAGVTRGLATTLNCNGVENFTYTALKREIVILQEIGGTRRDYNGRYFVRYTHRDGSRYFQAIYDCNGKPIRVDTNIRNTETNKAATLLYKEWQNTPNYTPLDDTAGDFQLATFLTQVNIVLRYSPIPMAGNRF